MTGKNISGAASAAIVKATGAERDVPDGYKLVWVEEPSDHWRLATEEERETRPCRMIRCDGTPVAALNRKHWTGGTQWWLYCAKHLYGRRIHEGRVEYLKAVLDPEAVSRG